jgi:hypothetical protein
VRSRLETRRKGRRVIRLKRIGSPCGARSKRLATE